MDFIDQGLTGWCASAAVVNALLFDKRLEQPEAGAVFRDLYFAAQKRDRFGGGEYPGAFYYRSGTTLTDSLSAAAEAGYFRHSRRLNQVDEIVTSLVHGKVVLAEINWYLNMLSVDKSCIESSGPAVGRHSIAIVRNSERFQHDYPYRLVNSFGIHWGSHGTAALSADELKTMIKNGEFHIIIEEY